MLCIIGAPGHGSLRCERTPLGDDRPFVHCGLVISHIALHERRIEQLYLQSELLKTALAPRSICDVR